MTPEGDVATPEGGVATPEGGVATPEGDVVTPEGGVATPEGGVATPEGGVATPGVSSDNDEEESSTTTEVSKGRVITRSDAFGDTPDAPRVGARPPLKWGQVESRRRAESQRLRA